MAPGRKVSKRAYRKAKRVISKQKKSKVKQNLDTHYVKCVTSMSCTPSQGLTVSNYFSQSFLLTATASQTFYANNADFMLYKQMYDRYRVNRVRVKYTPKANVLDSTLIQAANLTMSGDGMFHTCIDRDGSGPAGIAQMTRYASYKPYSLHKKWQRSFGVKYPKSVWLDCNDPTGSQARILDIGLGGGITVYAENVPETLGQVTMAPIGDFDVEFDVVFQGKIATKLTAITDIVGNVIGVAIEGPNPVPTVPPSARTNVRGTINVDTRTTPAYTETLITPNE